MTEKLSNMKERDRMEYYITTFLNYAEDGNYSKAYNMLYENFKAKYFPTDLKFEEYAKTHFISMEDKEFTNIERQDNTYYMWVTIKDVLNGKKDDPGVEYTFVIRENSLNDIDLSFIRDNITYVSQNESLFSGTIRKNLELVSSEDKLIQEVSEISLLYDLYKKNNISDNYYIEENGYNLSGGERKKIILARGLLHFKEVLVLDEVFNEISVEEERIILKNIFARYSNKIVILISHRQDNMDLFDKKYAFEGDGCIHEIK